MQYPPPADLPPAHPPLLQVDRLVQPSPDLDPPRPAFSWTVHTGEFWVIAGRPGSGKSELLAALAGLRALQGGDVRLDGCSISTAASPETRRARLRLGLVFEGGGRLFHSLTVAGNIALPLEYHALSDTDDPRGRVADLLEFAGLTRQAHLTPGRLKPAARQRAALARSLALQPRLLLLDNPAAGLPPLEIQWWQQALQHLHTGHPVTGNQQVTIILACDDPRPWWAPERKFVRLNANAWEPLGELASDDPRHRELLQDLLAVDPAMSD
jgi:ABC-type sulfate/molybdate transport systems ATPase subunit